MTIELQTGLPGACKTQYTLWRVEALRKKTGRPVFYSGIPIDSAKLPDWQPIEAKDWPSCPPESIVVIDEAQRLFRPRANGSAVPEYEAALETHRHGGIDLVLITQNPRLVSVGVRSLVGRHLHAVRHFGMQRSTIHEWAECKLNTASRGDSIKHQFKYKPEVFGWYKSAEAHTVERRIPPRVMLLVALPFVLLAIAAWLFHFLSNKHSESKAIAAAYAASAASASSSLPGSPASGGRGASITLAEYLASFKPRIEGLAFTAPVYDEVTKPVRAPYPAACIQSASRCSCYSQQGTRLGVPELMCKSIAAGGFFMAWDEKRPEVVASNVPKPATPIQPLEGGYTISLGGRPNSYLGSDQAASDKSTGDGVARARGQNGSRPPNTANSGGGYGS